MAEAGDRNLPLAFAEALSVEAFDPALFAAICCPDLKSAAERIAKYKPLIGPLVLDVEDQEHSVTITMSWPTTLSPPPALGHVELLFWVALARLCTRSPIHPERFVATSLPADMDSYQEYLGVAPVLGDRWSVHFSEMDAARPFLTANEGLWSFFEPELRRRLAELEESATISERVASVLLELLPTGDATAEAVARKLAMSKRTLQRRLRGDGTSFQALLSTTRESLARHYLSRSQLPAAEISFLLGYEDPNSFYRAFHAWTGSTPEALRAAAAG